ncbi:NAD(P)H-dependent oxidoreductase [Halobacteriovorax sp. XZX-3]|uniref:FMN-dependent NADH-azoreductase n=1 Tax=unclassified Halobacteriovorax TaxID=2639665 RepID=UPI003720C00E
MKTVLHVDSSPRRLDNENSGWNSISRRLARNIVDSIKERVDDEFIFIYRNLADCPPSFITNDWIAAVFTPNDKRSQSQIDLLAESDLYIKEVRDADIIVLSSPMYNYGLPAILKAWFDQIIRINETFTFDLSRGDFPLEPILSGKKLILCTSSGEFGFEPGGMREMMNHLGPHVKTMSKYLGVDYFFEIKSEYQEFGDKRHKKSLESALEYATQLGKTI